MKAIILAAGRGSRMGSATTSLPKCRTLFRGKELIQWQLDALRAAGINDIAIVRGYLADTFDFENIYYFENTNWQNTNMFMSLMAASEWLGTNECVVSYSDIVYSSDAVIRLLSSDCDIAITYDPNWLNLWSVRFADPLSDAETFRLTDGYVSEIGGVASTIDEIQGQYMGLLKFTPAGWSNVEKIISRYSLDKKNNMDMTKLLQELIIRQVKISGTPISDPWFEVDSTRDIEAYKKMIGKKKD